MSSLELKRKREDGAPTERSEKRRRRSRRKNKSAEEKEDGPNGVDTAVGRRTVQKRENGERDPAVAASQPPQRPSEDQINGLEKRGTKSKKKSTSKAEANGEVGYEGSGEDTKTFHGPRVLGRALEDTALVLASERSLELVGRQSKQDKISQRNIWRVSEPIGGRIIDTAPVLSQDEQYLICATEAAISVYSTSDSTLKHNLQVDKSFICTFALSAVEKDVVWGGTHGGKIYKWNFVDGHLLGRWKTETPIQCLKTAKTSGKQEMVYTLSKKGGWNISAHRIASGKELESAAVLSNQSAIRSFETRDGGNVIIAITLDSVIAGYAMSRIEETKDLQQMDYSWQEVKCSEPPMCFDVKVKRKSSKANGPGARQWTVDVVVGGARGCIYVFDNLLAKLDRTKPSTLEDSSLSAVTKQLHWHREAVAAVTWSLDGNYIVSGGRETTLVLWQLETGRKQFLPNLESPILDLEVSPSGTSYVVRLADNSVMVLSTSELSPTAHVAGVQSTSFSKVVVPIPRLPTVDLLTQLSSETSSNYTPAAITPQSSDHLLLAVPAQQSSLGVAGVFSPAPYLQDFDISAARFSSRQALTRTNATNMNLGPEGNSILEPDVKFISVSHNGHWLATVDEWEPPRKDLQDLVVNGDAAPLMRESKLRIWSWNDTDKNWMLNSRIDEPHRLEDKHGCVSVLGLVSDPSSSRFATIGSDAIVRTWAPKSRLKNGKVIRGEIPSGEKSKVKDTWWAVEHIIPLDKATAFDALESVAPDRGVLTFSNDGSILAVYQHHDAFESTQPVVHLIDTNVGILQESRSGLLETSDGLHGLAFLGKHLICLGRDAATVWDITSFDLHSLIQLGRRRNKAQDIDVFDSAAAGSRTETPIPHLAVDITSNTFAIASHDSQGAMHSLAVHPLLKFRTELSIFSPDSGSEALFKAKLPRTTMALLPASGNVSTYAGDESLVRKRGYVILDIGAEIRTIDMSRAVSRSLPNDFMVNGFSHPSEPASEDDPAEGTDVNTAPPEADDGNLVVEEQTLTSTGLPKYNRKSEDSRPVVRREQLAEVFDYPTQAMPSMKDLFKSLVSLYAGDPTRQRETEGADGGADAADAGGVEVEGEEDEESSESSSDSD